MARQVEGHFLTLSYLDREPRSAARVLESLGANDAAAFFDRAPARIVAPVIAMMIPWSAARCLERMDAEKAAGVLRSMNYSDAVSILRLVEEEKRERLLDCSTRRFARSFRNSLTYPRDTVGSWMDVDIPAFPEDTRIRDVLRALKRVPGAGSHVFVIDADKQFSGVVSLAEILGHDDSAILEDLTDRSLKPLSNRETLRTCQARPDWDHMTLLPVVGRKQNFLGALRRASLRKALDAQDGKDDVAKPGSVPMQLLTAMMVVGMAFADLMLPKFAEPEPTAKKRKSRGRQR